LRIYEHPHELEAKVAQARERYQVAEAMVEVAQAKLDAIQAGPTQQQLELARGRVQEAEASKQLAETQLTKTRIYAPMGGTVVELPLRAGESAQQGVRLAVIADLTVIDLQVYIPESELGRVYLSQQASVTVDPFPDRSFQGQVTYIASEAEYMPRGVQSKEQRVNMVFAVRIQLDNPQYLLKPGMPADVVFQAEESGG
jgi:HlyD family secretion protein